MKGRFLEGQFGATAYPSIPANTWLGMSTAPWATSTDAQILAAEPTVTTGGYVRPEVANNTTNWSAITVGSFVGSATSTNLQAGPGPTGAVSFAASTGSGWTSAGNFLVTAFWSDSATPGAGNLLWVGTPVNASGVALSLSVNQAGITLYIAAGGWQSLLL